MSSSKPNFLFIFTDQQHANMMSCAGNAHCHTPAMDSLAESGVRFTRAYCGNPVCIPSRFTLFTGRLPSAIGLTGNNVEAIPPVPESILKGGMGHVFRNAGYKVLYGGKQHLPKMDIEDLGFDVFETDEREGLADTCADLLSKPSDDPFLMVASFINPHDICYMAIRDFAETDFDHWLLKTGETEVKCLDEALQLPKGMSEEEFFSSVCPPLPDNLEIPDKEPEAVSTMLRARDFKRKARENYTDKQWRMHRWAYARLTERVDRQIAKVLDGLRSGPNADNTIVIYSSDHGDMDGSHRMEHKTAFYQEASNIPFIINYPSMPNKGIVDSDHVISNGLDLFPTLCDYAGIDCPSHLQGKSLKPIVEGNAPENWHKAVPVESDLGRMIVTGRYKYCHFFEGKNAEQLCDLEVDPGEMRNFASDPAYASILAEHRKCFESVFSTIGSTKS